MAEDDQKPVLELGPHDDGPSQKKEVSIPECTVHSVVVYPDRAEVTRLVTVEFKKGSAEVVLKNISKSLDKDSIRVDGIGPASVTEVSFQEIAITQEEDESQSASEEVVQLKEGIKETDQKKQESKQQEERTESQIQLLYKYSNGLLDAGGQTNTSDLLDQKTMDGVFNFLETFEEQTVRLRVAKDEVHASTADIEKEGRKLTKRLNELQPILNKPSVPAKQQVIGILLDIKEEDAEIQLLVSYVVSNAGWSPKYDLRVSSSERTMDVTYFGVVKQNTGEDWLNARLSLSTATPSIGGTAPKLDTLKLSLVPNMYPKDKGGAVKAKRASRGFGYGEDSSSIEAPQARVSEGLINSVFEITTPTNVPADNSGHKVYVAKINLKPTFEYDTVPKLAQHAFLRAKVTNNSDYPFLAGPSNVFLDNSYVTETTLDSVSPNEEFSCSLGVDSSVKVVYKPVTRFREETGLISKVVKYTYKQVTEILNTRSESAVITFTDQVPKSEDEKLKVLLVEPVIPKPKQGVPLSNPKLNAQNNVEWRLELSPGESKSVSINYTVEFPVNKQVEGL